MTKQEKEKYNWQWENSINTKGYIEFGVAGDPEYDAFRTNRSLSNFPDTVLQSNIMNMNYHLDHKLQYDFLYYEIRKKKRGFKNRKKSPKDELFTLVQNFYKYNNQKTREALAVLSEEQLEIIKRKMDKGGVK